MSLSELGFLLGSIREELNTFYTFSYNMRLGFLRVIEALVRIYDLKLRCSLRMPSRLRGHNLGKNSVMTQADSDR
jgi:hypothetical protein